MVQVPASVFPSPFELGGPESLLLLLFFLAAAICHAGIAAFPPPPGPLRSDELSLFDASMPGAGAGAGAVGSDDDDDDDDVAAVASAPDVDGRPLVFGWELEEVGTFGDSGVPPIDLLPTLFSSSFLRLCSSSPNSSRRASPFCFHCSSDFGTSSFNPAT